MLCLIICLFMCRTGAQHCCGRKGSSKFYAADEWNSNFDKGLFSVEPYF